MVDETRLRRPICLTFEVLIVGLQSSIVVTKNWAFSVD